MKLVTFGGDMAPHGAGDTRLVPDEVAQQLEDDGKLSASEPWPADAASRAPEKPVRPILKPGRPTGGSSPRTAR